MFSLNNKGRLVSLEKPIVMGILNFTPDSFYAPSRTATVEDLLEKVALIFDEGAAMVDLGAQSSRPGSNWLSAAQEWERLEHLLPALVERFPERIFSIDTFHHRVAEKAVAAGASLVNDISAGKLDPDMVEAVAALGVPYVCMHMKGSPQTMEQFTSYENLLPELSDYFIERITACRLAGIKDLIIDPGFGFSKTLDQNYELMARLQDLAFLNCPILVGISRKSMVTKTLGIRSDQALNGTTALNTIALMNGASILRVHDVKEAVEAIEMVGAIKKLATSSVASFLHV